jgi:hypothetical protein
MLIRKRWWHDHKTWTSDNWKHTRDVVRCVNLHAVPYIRKSLRLDNTQGSLQSGMPVSNSETRGRFCDGLANNIIVQYSVGLIITLHGRNTAREYVHRFGNQVHPMNQTLFPNNNAVFLDDNALIHAAATSTLANTYPGLNITEPPRSVLKAKNACALCCLYNGTISTQPT